MNEEVKPVEIGKILITTAGVCLVSITGIIFGFLSATIIEKILTKILPNQHAYRIFSNIFYLDLFGLIFGIITGALAGIILTSYLLSYGNIFGALVGGGSFALFLWLITRCKSNSWDRTDIALPETENFNTTSMKSPVKQVNKNTKDEDKHDNSAEDNNKNNLTTIHYDDKSN